jgi:hypothetical protein
LHRLTLRASWPLLAALILCVCGLNYGLPKLFPGATMEVPLLPLLIIEVGFTLSAALLFYDEANPVQAIKISLVILAITVGFACFGDLANPSVFSEVRFRPGSQAPVLSINWVFLLTVNFSAVAVAKALIKLSAGQAGGRKRQSPPQSDR